VPSPAMAAVQDRIRRYAEANTPVVLVGETGTGKSYFARILHELSGRSGNFVDTTAGELDPELAPSQLFGHVRGAFTGAVTRRVGLFAEAASGTLLFDDFHLLSRALQYLLLAAFDLHAYRPVGTDRRFPVTFRLVLGLGRDPDALVESGDLLKDLRYRLGHCIVRLPPLAERREEIPSYARLFLGQCPARTGVTDGPAAFTPEAIAVLEAGCYPGNLRDLRELIVEAFLHARADGAEAIGVRHVAEHAQASLSYDSGSTRKRHRAVVAWALWKTKDNVAQAAALIGASRNTVATVRAELQAREEKRQVFRKDPRA
jgi:DNA-binding NtrC family response regulator